MRTLPSERFAISRALRSARLFSLIIVLSLPSPSVHAVPESSTETLLNDLVNSERLNPASSNILETVIRLDKAVRLLAWTDQSIEIPTGNFQDVLSRHPQWNLLDTNQV